MACKGRGYDAVCLYGRKQRAGKPGRDEFIRPMIDPQGVLNRFTTNVRDTERGILNEFEDNRSESREAVAYASTSWYSWPCLF